MKAQALIRAALFALARLARDGVAVYDGCRTARAGRGDTPVVTGA